MSASRTEFQPTRKSLVSRLHDLDDQDSWRDFFNLYWKLIFKLCLRRGLTQSEAEEATQETIIAVAKTMPGFEYKPGQCSFKGWLCHLTSKKIADQYRKRKKHRPGAKFPSAGSQTGTDPAQRVPDPEPPLPEEVWEAEWRQHLIDLALDRVKAQVNPAQFRMFSCVALRHQSPSEVARTLDVSIASVYLAKHRIGSRLKAEVRRLERELQAARPQPKT